MKEKKTLWSLRDLFLLGSIFYFSGIISAFLFFVIFFYTTEDLNNRGDQVVRVYDYASYSNIFRNEINEDENREEVKDYQLWESTTVIRSALYYFVMNHKSMPESLSLLTNEYITGLPKEPITFSNHVESELTETGGWVYKPLPINSLDPEEVKTQVEKALFPNVLSKKREKFSFEPVKIEIFTNENTLQLVSGEQILRIYEVGLGAFDKTPIGTFKITKKIVNPNHFLYSSPYVNPYGKRGLQLSDPLYAIHGTNNPESISQDISNGCIRMKNKEIVELYSMSPLYTSVVIMNHSLGKNKSQSRLPGSNLSNRLLYDETDRRSEEDSKNIYYWAG